MSIGGAISGTVRALLIAAATGAAVLGLLVVLHPFEAVRPAVAVTADPAADALRAKIADARDALAHTEAALRNVNGPSSAIGPDVSNDSAQLEVQSAATTERRDLALRHAQAIRAALKSAADLGALAEIRDSVVIGQLLTQRAALDAQVAEQGARLKPIHPTMRALNAQKAALAAQVRAEAASIATALEAEAKLDDAQLKQLQSRLGGPTTTAAAPDAGTLAARASAQRTELDGLVDSYFDLAPKAVGASGSPANILSPLNLFVAAIAAIAAAMFQLGLALRRRRLRRQATADLARWHRDHDPELPAEPAMPELRRAS
jgi:hypothetical protein